jgi:hypothetical protein
MQRSEKHKGMKRLCIDSWCHPCSVVKREVSNNDSRLLFMLRQSQGLHKAYRLASEFRFPLDGWPDTSNNKELVTLLWLVCCAENYGNGSRRKLETRPGNMMSCGCTETM